MMTTSKAVLLTTARLAKLTAEREIYNALKKFEADTGLSVTDVEVAIASTATVSGERLTTTVKSVHITAEI
jgi:hypothetical protein